MRQKISIFWFRRDLRLEDNTALNEALKGPYPVFPFFIFDPYILDRLESDDARVTFLYNRIRSIRSQLEKLGSTLAIFHGDPLNVIRRFNNHFDVVSIYTNQDYEPYARQRDSRIKVWCQDRSIDFFSYKDQVIFEKNEVTKKDGLPYTVYTPYMKAWKNLYRSLQFPERSLELNFQNLIQHSEGPDLTLEQIGFTTATVKVPDYQIEDGLILNYEATRNFPGIINGTSRLGPHLRFGTVSIRELVKKAAGSSNETFLNELIWREFFMQILWHFPHTVSNAFKPKYDRIEWRNDEEDFERWKNGTTGFPLVDAGMRELNSTGYMHNRVRMLVAGFLCKHLLIDWRWGETYFASKLLDYEMSSNVGNWQWAAGSGVDAAPYFRIFNPNTQLEKFDKDRVYVSKWIPELGTDKYPEPMIDHKEARERCLRTYKMGLE